MKPWQKAERDVVTAVGGHRQPGSGSGPNKSDVRYGHIALDLTDLPGQIETKSTEAASLRVEKAWLEKIQREALNAGRTPVFTMAIQDQGWICFPLWLVEVGEPQ